MGGWTTKHRVLALAVALAAVTALCVSAAGAASPAKNGIRLLSPKNGAAVPTVIASGKVPTFKARVRGRGSVWFTVCKSKKRGPDGQLCRGNADDLDRGKKGKKTKRGRSYSFKPDVYTFPTYYLNTPGTYYWQVFRISCRTTRAGRLDCPQESKLGKFVVK